MGIQGEHLQYLISSISGFDVDMLFTCSPYERRLSHIIVYKLFSLFSPAPAILTSQSLCLTSQPRFILDLIFTYHVRPILAAVFVHQPTPCISHI